MTARLPSKPEPDATKTSRPTWSSLPEHFQQAGNKFVRNGIMTKDQYIDDLIKLGELKGPDMGRPIGSKNRTDRPKRLSYADAEYIDL